jgi:NADH:ubiquinone oxidoreductase subunit 3 (subunit A)
MSQLILATPIAFIIFLIIAYLIYKVGGTLGVKKKVEGRKLDTYACGEDIPTKKMQHAYQFFRIAFFFTILHVAALIIVTVPSGTMALLGILYLLVAITALVILLVDKEVIR